MLMIKLKKMKTKTEKILTVLKIVAWIVLIGFSMECGSRIASFLISFKNPDLASKFYEINENFFQLRQFNIWYFNSLMFLAVLISAVKVHIWYIVIELFLKINLKTPFSIELAKKLEKITFSLIVIWALSFTGRIAIELLSKQLNLDIGEFGVGNEFLFLSGIIYIVSQIYKRGIEIQEENQLTV